MGVQPDAGRPDAGGGRHEWHGQRRAPRSRQARCQCPKELGVLWEVAVTSGTSNAVPYAHARTRANAPQSLVCCGRWASRVAQVTPCPMLTPGQMPMPHRARCAVGGSHGNAHGEACFLGPGKVAARCWTPVVLLCPLEVPGCCVEPSGPQASQMRASRRAAGVTVLRRGDTQCLTTGLSICCSDVRDGRPWFQRDWKRFCFLFSLCPSPGSLAEWAKQGQGYTLWGVLWPRLFFMAVS